jgi:hypothetical protein
VSVRQTGEFVKRRKNRKVLSQEEVQQKTRLWKLHARKLNAA